MAEPNYFYGNQICLLRIGDCQLLSRCLNVYRYMQLNYVNQQSRNTAISDEESV
jgi:hypothetical protein